MPMSKHVIINLFLIIFLSINVSAQILEKCKWNNSRVVLVSQLARHLIVLITMK